MIGKTIAIGKGQHRNLFFSLFIEAHLWNHKLQFLAYGYEKYTFIDVECNQCDACEPPG